MFSEAVYRLPSVLAPAKGSRPTPNGPGAAGLKDGVRCGVTPEHPRSLLERRQAHVQTTARQIRASKRSKASGFKANGQVTMSLVHSANLPWQRQHAVLPVLREQGYDQYGRTGAARG